MRYICTSIVATLMLAGTSLAQDAVEWRVEDGGNGHWYLDVVQQATWAEADATASAVGAHLATTVTYEEFQFVWGLAGHGRWLGARQPVGSVEPAGGWEWVTGEPWNDWPASIASSFFDDCDGGGSPTCADGCTPDGQQNRVITWQYGTRIDDDNEWGCPEDGGVPTLHSYVLEWSADCNDDGIVDYGQILDGTFADANGNGVPDCCDEGEPCSSTQAVQWPTGNGGNGHWYEFILVDQSRPQHDAQAQARGGHLVTITSQGEGNFVEAVRDAANAYAAFHTGGWQDPSAPDYAEPDGGWRWVTGEAFDYVNWGFVFGADQPDNDNGEDRLGLSWQEDDVWCDVHDTTEWFAMVEWSADCNGDGIVDYGQILDGTFLDTDGNGVPDCCDVPGGCDDCNDNGVLDSEDVADGTSEDCNANGVPDECDTADGTSEDCNANGVPDECETLADCDGDGTSDACELLAGAIDTNPADGIPDECQGSPSGACCFGSQCVRVTLANCSSSGGEYFGDGSSCADSPCGPSGTGACCLNGACISATLGDCFVAGGSFAGALAGCSDVSCPVECTGDANYDGVVNIEDLLVMLSAWGPCP